MNFDQFWRDIWTSIFFIEYITAWKTGWNIIYVLNVSEWWKKSWRNPIEKLDVKNNVKKDVRNGVKNDVKNNIKNDVKNYVKNEVKNWDRFLRHFWRRFLCHFWRRFCRTFLSLRSLTFPIKFLWLLYEMLIPLWNKLFYYTIVLLLISISQLRYPMNDRI